VHVGEKWGYIDKTGMLVCQHSSGGAGSSAGHE
jgi:hypothetical protein